MDVRTGRIYRREELAQMNFEDAQAYMREMAVPPTPKQQRLGRVGRNERCPCGSGKKFKKCCLRKA